MSQSNQSRLAGQFRGPISRAIFKAYLEVETSSALGGRHEPGGRLTWLPAGTMAEIRAKCS